MRLPCQTSAHAAPFQLLGQDAAGGQGQGSPVLSRPVWLHFASTIGRTIALSTGFSASESPALEWRLLKMADSFSVG